MQIFNVKGMTCDHCVRAVTQAVQTLDPAAKVKVDLAQGEVQVSGAVDDAAIIAALGEEGYEAQVASAAQPSSHGSCCGKCGGAG